MAIYLYNQIARASNNWKSLYKIFYNYVFNKKKIFGLQKQLFYHLRAFEYKVYILIKSKKDPHYRQKHCKFDVKAHIGFLISYQLTNIYKIWVPHK